MELLYQDDRVLVCVKPPGVLSTDEPGGMPDLLRQALGDPEACVRTVHRLDRVVGGLMVFARTRRAAGDLSAQIRSHQFQKEYWAVIHGRPTQNAGTFTDLLVRQTDTRRTRVVDQPGPGVQSAVLDYAVLAAHSGLSLVRIQLHTGRTHQIRVQFSSRDLPLVGDRKYGRGQENCEIALWSHRLCFRHPRTDQPLEFIQPPPCQYPWSQFQLI